MKKIFFALFSLAVVSAQAQTADEIIQKHSAAMGGLDAFNKVQSAVIKGTVSTQGVDLPITIQVLNGKGMRNDVEVMGQSITNVYYNGKGWKVNPIAGINSPTEVTGNELSDFKSQSMLASQLIDYKARGHKVELAGQEDVDGVKALKILLTNKDDGKVTTYFINTSDLMVIKTITKREMQGQEFDVETYFSDYKDYGGLKIATTRTQKIEGQVFQEIKFTSFDLNVPVDVKIFDMPKQ